MLLRFRLLELPWKDPSKMTLGGYTCFVNGIDRQGHPVVLTGALQMTSVSPSISDVVGYIDVSLSVCLSFFLSYNLFSHARYVVFSSSLLLSLSGYGCVCVCISRSSLSVYLSLPLSLSFYLSHTHNLAVFMQLPLLRVSH